MKISWQDRYWSREKGVNDDNQAVQGAFGLSKMVLHTDGASRGNPGEAGIGIVIYDENGVPMREIARYLGKVTNNIAEYTALIEGLRAATELGAKDIIIRSDSELMVRQVMGEYKVRNQGLQPLFVEARRLLMHFHYWRLEYVPRELNRRADELANEGIDQKQTTD